MFSSKMNHYENNTKPSLSPSCPEEKQFSAKLSKPRCNAEDGAGGKKILKIAQKTSRY